MTTEINSETYYKTSTAVKMIGISKSTLLRWVKEGTVSDSSHRDRRGWRLFSKEDIQRIKSEVNSID